MLNRAAFKSQLPYFTNRVGPLPIFCAMIILSYVMFSYTVYTPHIFGIRVYVVYGVVAFLVLSGVRVSYALATPAYRILTRSVIAFTTFYIAVSHVTITSDLVADKPLAAFELNYLWMIATVCGLIGFVRPSFGLVPLLYLPWYKQHLAFVFATPVEWMDYFTVVETGSFLILSYLLYVGFRLAGVISPRLAERSSPAAGQSDSVTNSLHPVDIAVLFAVALHFSNYFYAGFIKAALGDSPVDWVLNNRTELLVLAAWNSTALPVSFMPGLPDLTYKFIADVRVVTNLITISTQLFAVMAILRIRWAIIVTLCYDLLHLIIFVTTGIFFWKFILLNLAIVAALATIKARHLGNRLQCALASAVIFAPFVFHIMPSFAWLDTPAVNEVRLFAVTAEGETFHVPSNFFLGRSVNFAQNRLVWPARGPFPTQTWGTTRDPKVAKAAQDCSWDRKTDEEMTPLFQQSQEQISETVRRNHVQILSMLDENGHLNYDLYPHHIFSMPWYYRDFKALDKRRIVAYRYESSAACLDYRNGQLTRDVKFASGFDIPLRDAR